MTSKPSDHCRAVTCSSMDAFPEFMRNPSNRIAQSNQTTPGVEGYVFDGADQSQMAFWTCTQTATSAEHVHEFDEYMLVVQGCYTLLIAGKHIPIKAGEEYLIPRERSISNDWVIRHEGRCWQLHPGFPALRSYAKQSFSLRMGRQQHGDLLPG
jgi:quercetin dioxygenase-like cupin family protein